MDTIAAFVLLIIIANGAPIVSSHVFRHRFTAPLDGNRKFIDGKPWLGPSKTYRGLISALLFTSLFAPWFGLSWQTGFWIGLFSMSGDLLSSFCKRRLGMASSSQALFLDQIPESLIPALICASELAFNWKDIFVIVGSFFILELTLSIILYRFKIRKQPY